MQVIGDAVIILLDEKNHPTNEQGKCFHDGNLFMCSTPQLLGALSGNFAFEIKPMGNQIDGKPSGKPIQFADSTLEKPLKIRYQKRPTVKYVEEFSYYENKNVLLNITGKGFCLGIRSESGDCHPDIR